MLECGNLAIVCFKVEGMQAFAASAQLRFETAPNPSRKDQLALTIGWVPQMAVGGSNREK